MSDKQMIRSTLFIAITVVSVLSSCSKQTSGILERTGRTETPKSTMEQINWGVKDFSIDIFRAVSADIEKEAAVNLHGKNILLSPLSLAMALSMTEGGAEGDTAEEMKTVLGFSGVSQEDFVSYFKNLSNTLQTADAKVETDIVNSIWSDRSFPVKDSFKEYSEYWYDATVRTRDFKQASTADEINGWCFDKTRGKIPAITTASEIHDLCMCLLNSLYFKADWTNEFEYSTNLRFHCYNEALIMERDSEMGLFPEYCSVQMMHSGVQLLPYCKSSEFTFVEIPYGNGSFAFDILLSNDSGSNPEDRIYESIAALSGEKFENLVSTAQKTAIALNMPGFKMEYTAESLIDNLKSLGMKKAFLPDTDFSGMSDESSFIGLIRQKSYIEVTEKGTEAAAATMVGMLKESFGGERTPSITVDRPYIFVIRETSTDTILFIGAVVTF